MVAGSVEPEPLLIEDVRTDPRFADSPQALAFPDIGSYVAVPIKLSDRTFLGTLCGADPEPRRVSSQQIDLLTVLSLLLATEIERNRETAARERAEERYRLLAEQGSDVLAFVAMDGHLTYISPAVERVLGYRAVEYSAIWAGPSPHLVHHDDRDAHDAAYAAAFAGREQSVECRFRTKGGGDRWVAATYGPLVGDGGRQLGVRAVLRDVHDEKTTRLQLHATERRFHAFMNQSPVVAFMKDGAGHYQYVNQPFERQFGVSSDRLLGKTDDEWMPANVARQVRDNDRAVLASGRPSEFVEMVPKADGEHRYWLSMKFPFGGDDGRDCFVGGVAVDITERRRQQLDLARLAAIVESSTDAIIGKSLDGTITSWNPAAQLLFGYTPYEAVGRPITMLVAPGQPNDGPELLARVSRGERVEQQATRWWTKDGRPLDVELTISPVRDADGRIVGAATIARYVTERKRVEADREQLHAELRADYSRAAEVQARLLPRSAPEVPGYEFAAACLPAREIGGDFFDWSCCEGRIRVSLGDVMGKGMPAALLMATVRAALRSVSHLPVTESVEAVNRALTPDLAPSDAFVTLFHADLDPASGALAFADAGHGLAFVRRRDGTVETLRQRGLPIGILDDVPYTGGTVTLDPGDVVVIYSDGLPDARPDLVLDPAGVAAHLRDLRHVDTMLERLIAVASEEETRPDDLTIVIIGRRGDEA